jgi:hypothetical protein
MPRLRTKTSARVATFWKSSFLPSDPIEVSTPCDPLCGPVHARMPRHWHSAGQHSVILPSMKTVRSMNDLACARTPVEGGVRGSRSTPLRPVTLLEETVSPFPARDIRDRGAPDLIERDSGRQGKTTNDIIPVQLRKMPPSFSPSPSSTCMCMRAVKPWSARLRPGGSTETGGSAPCKADCSFASARDAERGQGTRRLANLQRC